MVFPIQSVRNTPLRLIELQSQTDIGLLPLIRYCFHVCICSGVYQKLLLTEEDSSEVCRHKDSKSSRGSLDQKLPIRRTMSSFQNSNRKAHPSLSGSTWHPSVCLRIDAFSKNRLTGHPLACLRLSTLKMHLTFFG